METQLLNKKLRDIFSNGKGESGLELGGDVGLPVEEYIQVPKGMKKNWCAKFDKDSYISTTGLAYPKNVRNYKEHDDPKNFKDVTGWVTSGKIQVHSGILEGQFKHPSSNELVWVKISEFHIDPPTIEDMKLFFTANQGHIRENQLDVEDMMWVHSVRYWSVVGGFVFGSKSKEYTVVDDPQTSDINADEFVSYAMNYSVNAWTAAAARSTSWRKTNHATGGDIAQGYPRRWLQKEGKISDIADKNARQKHEKKKTSAFYIATHASAVHVVLSLMAPSDFNHWAILDPSFGFIPSWEIGSSTSVRMSPNDQVSGSAVVVDSLVVLKMLVSEGLMPLLVNNLQANSLIKAYQEVNQGGIKCATYAKWFLEGHPLNVQPSSFSQRDPAYFELASELAIVSQKYYTGSTISMSAALQNISKQSINEQAKNNWSTVSAHRKELGSEDFLKAVIKIKGGASSADILKINDPDPVIASNAINNYNNMLRNVAAALNVEPALIKV